jgi:hypothetical protein
LIKVGEQFTLTDVTVVVEEVPSLLPVPQPDITIKSPAVNERAMKLHPAHNSL